MQFFPLQRFFQYQQMRASPIRSYECMSMESVNRAELNSGGKILLPQSALEDFLQMTTSDVMLFSVQNIQTNKKTHCGVLEFVAEEGVVHLPRWMMQTLDVIDRRIVQISIIQLPKGSFVKLQPHTQAFCSISNPRAVLEIELRKFATLTKGDAIMITYNSKNYYFNILEVKDESGAQVEAISIIEVNLQVDFETPLDYVEPVKPISSPNLSNVTPKVVEEKKEEPVEQDTGFKPFSGSAYSLRDNRKPPSYNNSNNNNNNNDRSISSPNLSKSTSISTPSLASSPPQGDLVFSDNSVKDPSKRVRKREPEQPSQAKKQSGFVPFQGEGRSLK